MNSKTPCPSDEALRDCLDQSYRGGDPGAAGEHVLGCSPCRGRAERMLKSETRFSDVRIAQSVAGRSVNGSVVDAILRPSPKPPTIAPASVAPGDPTGGLRFLDPPLLDYPNDLGLFDRYRIVEKLGQGGMGVVFRAVDTTLDRTVALKIILPQFAGDAGLRERFLQEAQATVKVRSPHVAEVYDCGVWNDVPYLTMELLVGVTLDQKPKPLALDAWRRIAYGIAKGLADAHRAGMIHRDLKPGNIHLGTDARSNKPTVKIIDFGLARPVDRKVEMTKSGVMLGTPAYMSLEQAHGEKVDHRTDLYSLGVILYQLATGKLPYANTSSVMAILTELAAPGRLPSVAIGAPDLPPALVALVDQLLAKNAKNRPESADEVMKALKASLNGDATASAAEVVPVLERAVPVRDGEKTVRPLGDRTLVEPMPVAARARPLRRRPRERERAPSRSIWLWPLVFGGVGFAAIVAIAFGMGAFSSRPANESARVGEGLGAGVVEPGAPNRPAPSLVDWADLPNLAEAVPRWQPVEAGNAERIRSARSAAIKDLPTFESKALGEYMLGRMMRGASDGSIPSGLFPPSFDSNAAPAPLTVPAKFLLGGDLVGVRSHDDKTWVILAGSATGPMTFGRSVGCLVEFPSAKLAATMMDYRVGDRVSVVAARAPREELRATVPPQAPAIIRELMLETRFAMTTVGSPQAYWSFRGAGIEKTGQAGTWIDAALGRAETAANDGDLIRAPTFLIRNPAAANGTRGRVAGAFRSMGKSLSGVSFTMQLANTAEGVPLLQAHIAGASLEEFIDYAVGDAVEAEVAIAVRPSSFVMPSYGPGPMPRAEGFSLDNALHADCLRVRKVGKPETTIVQFGERRVNVPAGKATPDTVYANPDRHVGAKVAWTGPLKKLRVVGDGTHVLVGVTGSVAGLTAFEARVPGKAFVDELADFVPSDESSAKADTVIITGLVESPVPGADRFDKDVPLVHLERIERPGDPESAAVSGQKRDPNSFRVANPIDDYTKLLRNPPPVGTAVRLQGRYGSFNSYDLTISLNPPLKTHSGNLRVKFTGASDALLKDYKSGDLVDVEAIVEEVGNALNRPKLRGKSIVRNANARSLVTETGRAFPPLDFAAMEKLWNDVRYASNPNATDPLRGGGIYESYTALEGRLKIDLKNGFFSYGNLDLYCADTQANRKTLDAFKPGDEMIFEAKSVTPPKGRSSSSYRQLDAEWIAPIGAPDKKFEFKPKP
jgi:tRNA A-37 threonylcarbamoyl transferase component Bud32